MTPADNAADDAAAIARRLAELARERDEAQHRADYVEAMKEGQAKDEPPVPTELFKPGKPGYAPTSHPSTAMVKPKPVAKPDDPEKWPQSAYQNGYDYAGAGDLVMPKDAEELLDFIQGWMDQGEDDPDEASEPEPQLFSAEEMRRQLAIGWAMLFTPGKVLGMDIGPILQTAHAIEQYLEIGFEDPSPPGPGKVWFCDNPDCVICKSRG